MPKIGLDRSDQQFFHALPVPAKYRAQRLNLKWISELRASSMCFDIADLARAQAGTRERIADHRLLRRSVWRGQSAARAVLVYGAAANDRKDAVAAGLGIRQALQHDDAAAFASAETIG